MEAEKTMSLSVLIFDVDGTLAETEEMHRRAFNLAFAESGLAWNWSHARYLELLGVTGGKERIRHFAAQSDAGFLHAGGADDRIATLHRLKTAHYVRLVGEGDIGLRPGVARLIREARESGLRLAIATTTSRANVINLLTATLGAEGPGLFDAISASDSAENKKPSPDVYFHVLKALDCAADHCIAFEDSQNGLRSARAAGIETVVTLSDFTTCDDPMDALAVLSDLGEPDQPFSVVCGDPGDHGFVSLELLNRWRTAKLSKP
jgi:HAD superfamily hydrolase (TIGR01509 family)